MTSNPFDIFKVYLNRNTGVRPIFRDPVPQKLKMIVVIPAFNEPELLQCLNSLDACSALDVDIEVIVVINEDVGATKEVKAQNLKNMNELSDFKFINSALYFKIFYLRNLPKKNSGVGIARKAGMDEALFRFINAGEQEGIIVCLDADCTVEKNYLETIYDDFTNFPKKEAASIYFEHRTDGFTGIHCRLYELHLRYYIEAQRLLRLPYAYQTVGSSMAVRARAYAAEGGMPKKKAGEDFYFLHKFIRKGTCGEINTTTIYPSCRPSNRVPFGTGKAIISALGGATLKTYPLESFFILKNFMDQLPEYYSNEKLNPLDDIKQSNIHLFNFLKQYDFLAKWEEIRKNTSTETQFINRFYRWFDAFLLMKYLHFMREYGFQDVDILQEAKRLKNLRLKKSINDDLDTVLNLYREKALRGIPY